MRISSPNVYHLLRRATVIFWDFDGVIKDSVSVKTAAFKQLFLGFGQEVLNRVVQHHEDNGGMSRFEKIPLYLEWAGEERTPQQVEDYCNQFSQFVTQEVIDSPWVPGVHDYLMRYHSEQHFILVSATPHDEILQILHSLYLGGCFRQVFGSPNDKTTAINTVLKSLKCSPADALMIGDSKIDMLAAHSNELQFILRCTSQNSSLQATFCGPMFDKLTHE